MATKTCPSCAAEVPVAARRCKECFHDFNETKPRNAGPISLLFAVAIMAMLGFATLWYVTSQPTDSRILVDESTRTVQWIKQFQDGSHESEKIDFDEIGRLEYVITSGGDFEIIAVTLGGERKVIEQNKNKPLQLKAERYARMMEKRLDIVDNTFGLSN